LECCPEQSRCLESFKVSKFVVFIRIWRNAAVVVSILTSDVNKNNTHCIEAPIAEAMNVTGIHLARMRRDVVDAIPIKIPTLDSSGHGLRVAI
jgi:hypothetical protein